ncbi:MAG TPA: carboxypeptidase-like regulatory domain-containing protein, partial [Polyangia bacterium]
MSGRGWLALLVALAIGSPAAAWAERAELPAPVEVRGRIEDEAGKPVAGADIVVTRADGSARRAAISDADGRFSVA